MQQAPVYLTYLSVGIAVLALVVSATAMWLTYLKKGQVRLTRPSVVYFGPDGSRNDGLNGIPKIFFRGLLIADAKRGRIVESLYASLQHNESKQNFNVRSEEHTSELQSLMSISYAVFCLKKKTQHIT